SLFSSDRRTCSLKVLSSARSARIVAASAPPASAPVPLAWKVTCVPVSWSVPRADRSWARVFRGVESPRTTPVGSSAWSSDCVLSLRHGDGNKPFRWCSWVMVPPATTAVPPSSSPIAAAVEVLPPTPSSESVGLAEGEGESPGDILLSSFFLSALTFDHGSSSQQSEAASCRLGSLSSSSLLRPASSPSQSELSSAGRFGEDRPPSSPAGELSAEE
ncbi:unnamed protein product, partial [Ectocarpus sp. 12 AP-2014]